MDSAIPTTLSSHHPGYAGYVHQLDPIAFSLFGEAVPWYWLNYLFGFFWCWFGLKTLSRKSLSPLSEKAIIDLLTWGWFGMLLGARGTYVLVYNSSWYREHVDQIFAFWNGGMSFHGGMLGVALATWFVAKKHRLEWLTLTDSLAVVVPWPLMTGRFCNFVNGELPGRPTNVPWAVLFPKPWDDFPRHPSQLYEMLTEGLVLGMTMLWSNRYKRYPGLRSAIFLAAYGSLRFFTEFTREPDPQLGYFFGRFTMGQILCLAMVLASLMMMMMMRSQRESPRY